MTLDPRNPDQLVIEFEPLVKSVCRRHFHTLPPRIEEDDLLAAGRIGLLLAARRYDPGTGSTFPAYARPVIRGQMQMEIRRMSWAPADAYASGELLLDLLSLESVLESDGEEHLCFLDDRPTPEEVLLLKEAGPAPVRTTAAKILVSVPRKYRTAMWLRYGHQRSQEEIGAAIGRGVHAAGKRAKDGLRLAQVAAGQSGDEG